METERTSGTQTTEPKYCVICIIICGTRIQKKVDVLYLYLGILQMYKMSTKFSYCADGWCVDVSNELAYTRTGRFPLNPIWAMNNFEVAIRSIYASYCQP